LRLPPDGDFRPFGRRMMQKAVTRFVSVSQATKDAHVAGGIDADRIDVVHTGLDLDHYRIDEAAGQSVRARLEVEPSVRVVLYAGRIDPEKGLEALLEAHHLLPPDTLLLIAGAPRVHPTAEAADAYLGRLRQQGDPSRVRWLGPVDDVRPLLGACDVAVLPSVWPEPSGRAVIESMACGRPIIASAVGGIPEHLVGFERFLIPPGDPHALATAIAGVLRWRDDEPALPAACRDHVARNFTLDRALDGLDAVFRRANAHHRGPRRKAPDGSSLANEGP
jgi:glycosyltransferase involved in cell wall biosynthesis